MKKKINNNFDENQIKINISQKLIELININKNYSKNNKNIFSLKNINLIINKGDRIGVIGANGSGKSTISEIIGGIRKPTSGKIIKKDNLTIGFQFQESKYPIGISVMDMIKYYLFTFNIKMTKFELFELLKTYQILGIENKFIESLSGGQQQRLNILLAIIHNPDLVILDEVSTGLDIEVRTEIFNFLKEKIINKNKSMFLVTHMMSEIEEFCNKFIYIDNGQIIGSGFVKDIVNKYGSVHNYALKKFKENKEKNFILLNNNKINNNKKYLKNKFISSGNNNSKNKPLINLMLKYYYKGFFVPFFLVLWPILILFLQGFAFSELKFNSGSYLHTLVGSVATTQSISVGIFIIPQTILEFKNSVLMKRIGATNIKPIFFVFSVIFVGFIFIILTFFWTLLWAGIFFGSKYTWEKIALPNNIFFSIPFLLIIFFSSLGLGMMLASLFNSTTAFIAISNVIFLPIAFLNGSFVPAELINKNNILKYVTYINPYKYCMDPFLSAWNDVFIFDLKYCIYFIISILLLLFYIILSSLKMKWKS